MTGNVDLNNLRPFLENGWKPILTTAFPHIIIFPFAEMLVFTMLLPYLNRPELVKKVWLSALISSGLILSYTTSLNIVVLGVEQVERSTFPLLSAIGKVNLYDVFQNIHLFLWAVIGIVDLFNLKNYQRILLPNGVILIFFQW